MLAVELKDLTYTYSVKTPFEKRALDRVNLAVEEGEFVGLIGATGSGKSTLIQHLNGLVKVQEGEVRVAGMNASDKKTLKSLRFTVGMVFQYPEYQLFEDTVAKDVAFGPKNMKLEKDEIDRRVRRAMEVVGLPYSEFAERSPFELSGGEKRRAAIAGVIAMEPKILVLDEPVAGLDPVGRREILALVKKLHEEVSPTVIMVSHYMDDIAEMADRIVALKDGRVVADGTPAEVFGAREELAAAGLALPTAARIVDRLAARGISLPRTIVTPRELADALAAYKSGGAAAASGATAAKLQAERDKTSEEVELQADDETIDEATGGATAAKLQAERDETNEGAELQGDGETIDEATGGATAAILQGGHDETGGDTELYADGGEVTGTAEKEDGENV